MNGRLRHVAWYRFRATFRRRWGSYVALVLLVGFIGGIAMGAVAAGRRTQSAFPAFLKSTNPSDLIAEFSYLLHPRICKVASISVKTNFPSSQGCVRQRSRSFL